MADQPSQIITSYVPPSIKERLKADAEKHYRSLAAEVQSIIATHYERVDAEAAQPKPEPTAA